MSQDTDFVVERVQTGVRIEKRILKVLKAFAEFHDMTLGDLLEGSVLNPFDGKTQLYNETITCAYFFLIRERMARFKSIEWEDFAIRNPDLLMWKDGILNRYYHGATLKSDLARSVFIFPDKCG